jgi:hypothetical protein
MSISLRRDLCLVVSVHDHLNAFELREFKGDRTPSPRTSTEKEKPRFGERGFRLSAHVHGGEYYADDLEAKRAFRAGVPPRRVTLASSALVGTESYRLP